MTHTFLKNFLIYLKLLQASWASILRGFSMVYFIIQQSSFVVPAHRSLVPGVFMSGTLEILYWQMRVQLVSGQVEWQENSECWPRFLWVLLVIQNRSTCYESSHSVTGRLSLGKCPSVVSYFCCNFYNTLSSKREQWKWSVSKWKKVLLIILSL